MIDRSSPELSHYAIRRLLKNALATPAGLPHVEHVVLTTLVSLRSVTHMAQPIAFNLARALLGGILFANLDALER